MYNHSLKFLMIKKIVFLLTFILTLNVGFSQNKTFDEKSLRDEELVVLAVHKLSLNDYELQKILRSLVQFFDTKRISNNNLDFSHFFLYFSVWTDIYKGKEEDFEPFFTEFLNVYNKRLILPSYYEMPPMHFYKSIADQNLVFFFEECIIDGGWRPDLNAYEIVNNKKETLLDYINYLLKVGRGDPDTMVFIRDMLHDECGAKFGAELD